MNPVLRFSKRLSRVILVVILVLAMLWVLPVLLGGNSHPARKSIQCRRGIGSGHCRGW